ncbi:hypothetical protein TNCV_1900591 [Trichonephila clavipes]|nr:hypothetical protein TNCV_1900591 [Trichonephila clavipes]
MNSYSNEEVVDVVYGDADCVTGTSSGGVTPRDVLRHRPTGSGPRASATMGALCFNLDSALAHHDTPSLLIQSKGGNRSCWIIDGVYFRGGSPGPQEVLRHPWLYQESYPNSHVLHHMTFASLNRSLREIGYLTRLIRFGVQDPRSLSYEDLIAGISVSAGRIRGMPRIFQNKGKRGGRPSGGARCAPVSGLSLEHDLARFHPNFEGEHPGGGSGASHFSSPATNITRGLPRIHPYREGTLHLQTSMPSPGFEPRPYGTTVSVASHYTGWATNFSFKHTEQFSLNG